MNWNSINCPIFAQNYFQQLHHSIWDDWNWRMLYGAIMKDLNGFRLHFSCAQIWKKKPILFSSYEILECCIRCGLFCVSLFSFENGNRIWCNSSIFPIELTITNHNCNKSERKSDETYEIQSCNVMFLRYFAKHIKTIATWN